MANHDARIAAENPVERLPVIRNPLKDCRHFLAIAVFVIQIAHAFEKTSAAGFVKSPAIPTVLAEHSYNLRGAAQSGIRVGIALIGSSNDGCRRGSLRRGFSGSFFRSADPVRCGKWRRAVCAVRRCALIMRRAASRRLDHSNGAGDAG